MNQTLRTVREARALEADIRKQVADLEAAAVTPDIAKGLRATPITTAYQVRQFDQCVFFLNTLADFGECAIVVRKRGGLEIWRKP